MDTAPAVKRPTQGLYLCCAVDLEREMPASPCSLAHRGCSVSDKYDIMMPDTVSPAADSSIHTLPCIFQHSWRMMASGCVVEFKWFYWNERTQVKVVTGLLNAAEQVIFIAQVCLWTHMHTHQFKPLVLALFVFLMSLSQRSRAASMLLVAARWIETSGLMSMYTCTASACRFLSWWRSKSIFVAAQGSNILNWRDHWLWPRLRICFSNIWMVAYVPSVMCFFLSLACIGRTHSSTPSSQIRLVWCFV